MRFTMTLAAAINSGIVVGSVVFSFVALVTLIVLYNGLAVRRVRMANAFSQIDVQLRRRSDLIPNLVEVVKGYAQHERVTLEAVIRARGDVNAAAVEASAGNFGAMRALSAASMALGGALQGLFARISRFKSQRSISFSSRAVGHHGKPRGFRSPGIQRRGHALQRGRGHVSRQSGRGRISI